MSYILGKQYENKKDLIKTIFDEMTNRVNHTHDFVLKVLKDLGIEAISLEENPMTNDIVATSISNVVTSDEYIIGIIVTGKSQKLDLAEGMDIEYDDFSVKCFYYNKNNLNKYIINVMKNFSLNNEKRIQLKKERMGHAFESLKNFKEKETKDKINSLDSFWENSKLERIYSNREFAKKQIISGDYIQYDIMSQIIVNLLLAFDLIPYTSTGENFIKKHPIIYGDTEGFRKQLAPKIFTKDEMKINIKYIETFKCQCGTTGASHSLPIYNNEPNYHDDDYGYYDDGTIDNIIGYDYYTEDCICIPIEQKILDRVLLIECEGLDQQPKF